RPCAAMRNRYRCASPGGHVGKFERDVSAANEQHSPGKGFEFEKIVAGDRKLLARDTQCCGLRPGRDDAVCESQDVAAHFYRIRGNKLRLAMNRGNALGFKSLNRTARKGIGERTLKGHQFR